MPATTAIKVNFVACEIPPGQEDNILDCEVMEQ